MLQNYSTIEKSVIKGQNSAIIQHLIVCALFLSASSMTFSQIATRQNVSEKIEITNDALEISTIPSDFAADAVVQMNHTVSIEANTWTYVTNPYPFEVSAEQIIEKNKGVINPTIYIPTVRNDQKSLIDYNEGYSTFNLSGGATSVGTVDLNSTAVNFDKNNKYGILNSGQSFLVEPLKSDDLILSNSMKAQTTRDDVMWGGKEPKARNRYWMNLTNANGNYSQTLMGYFKDATDDIDPGFDGNVFPGSQVTLYSFCNGIKLGIQGQAMPLTNDKYVVFGYKTKAAGMLSLFIPETELDFNGTMPLLLKDGLLGGFHMIKDAPYYFYSAAGTFNERFEIHYTDGSSRLAGDQDTMEDKVIVAYKDGDNIVVKANNGLYTEIEIYDMNAKVLKAVRDVKTDFTIIDGVQQQNQLLLINVKTTEGKYITKKIIF